MAPVAIFVGLVLEALKYVNLAIAPYLQAKLEREYSIFRHSVTILLWSFVAAMVVLAGADWTRPPGDPEIRYRRFDERLEAHRRSSRASLSPRASWIASRLPLVSA